MRNTKKAFTLVELIVVITILAILGTIAFISLQGYSAEARNAKRTSDLSSVASSLSVKLTNGMSVLSAVVDNVNKLDDTVLSIGWWTGTTVTTSQYKAGVANYTALDMKQSEFQDPSNNANYIIGATILAGWVYQLAATVESDGSNVALVTWMYNNRTAAAITGSITTSSNKFVLPITETGKFKSKDKVTISDSIGSRNITSISSDGTTITFDWNASATSNTGATITLNATESTGLIGDNNTTTATTLTTPVTDGWAALPY